MSYSKILGTGSYLPKKILTNQDMEKLVDTTSEWIVQRVGIKQRHIASKEESTAFMAEQAARGAIDMAGIKPEDVDMIIVGTSTPDYLFPSTACLLQHRLGLSGCPAFDVQAACSGFLYALSIADQFVRSGANKHVLVIGSECMSRILDWKDRTTCVIFGDGAGAVVIGPSNEPGIVSTHLHAKGEQHELLYTPHPTIDIDKTDMLAKEVAIRMEGREVYKEAVIALEEIVDETLTANQITKSDINWLIPHQANIRIIKATAKKLGLPMSNVVVTIDKQGNTSAASIPLALDESVRDGRIKSGDMLLLEAFGAGFVWGSALVKF